MVEPRLSGHQHDAMLALRHGGLQRDRAGWGLADGRGSLWRCQTQTVEALRKRGLCIIRQRKGAAMLTAAGRRYLEAHHVG